MENRFVGCQELLRDDGDWCVCVAGCVCAVTTRGHTGKIRVMMGYFCLLIVVFVTQICICDYTAWKHTECDINFLLLRLCYNYMRCNYWEKWEGNTSPLSTVFDL